MLFNSLIKFIYESAHLKMVSDSMNFRGTFFKRDKWNIFWTPNESQAMYHIYPYGFSHFIHTTTLQGEQYSPLGEGKQLLSVSRPGWRYVQWCQWRRRGRGRGREALSGSRCGYLLVCAEGPPGREAGPQVCSQKGSQPCADACGSSMRRKLRPNM